MFRKVAQARRLGFALSEQDRLVRTAGERSAAGSWYIDGARTIPVSDLLKRVAEQYAVSDDPRDYLFEAIRANTTNAPNENNDGFHQAELLRFDTRLGMPVYETYIGKPHHVNHKTDEPKAARGVIIDAHYNDESPALENCPRCTLKTAQRENRDATGLHCRRCGHLVKDEFVEILVGVDTRKDADFARGVKTGHLDAGSMGCNCLSTICNVCNHVAYARPEFCEHIRAGAKGSLWSKRGNLWVRTQPMEVEREVRRRGLNWDPTDFCYLSYDGFEVRKAFEYCQNVVFDEYSRVDQPADPKARQREILRHAKIAGRAPSPKELKMETDALLRAAAQRKRAQVEGSKFVVIRVNKDDADMHASTSLEEALAAAGLEPGEGDVEMCEVEAPDVASALEMFDEAKAKPANVKESDVVMQAPPNEPIVIQPPGGMAGAQPGMPGSQTAPGVSIDELQQNEPAPMAPKPNDQLSPAEMGMAPPGASAPRQGRTMRFRNAYQGWGVEVTPQGNARIFTANKLPVLVVRGPGPMDAQARYKFGREVMASLVADGLVSTAAKMKGIFTPKIAQVVDGAIDNMKEFEDKYLHDSVLDDAVSNMQMERDTPPKGVVDGGILNMQGDPRGKPPKSTQDDGLVDHADGKPEGVESVTQEDNTNMRDKRDKVNLGSDSALDDETHDHAEKLAKLAKLGAKIAHTSKPNMPFTVTRVDLAADKSVEVVVRSASMGPRKVSQKELLAYWKSLDQPRAVAPARAPTPAPLKWTVEQIQFLRNAGIRADVVNGELKVEAPSNKAVEARYKKALAGLEAKAKKQASVSEEAVKLGAIGSFCRALRIVATRQGANLEESPIRRAAEHLLAATRDIGIDAATGQPITYQGMDPELVRYLVAEIYQQGHATHLENLMNRAADLMERGDTYLLDAEADAANFRPALPSITAANVRPVDEVALRAMQMRHQAMQGNFPVRAQAPDEMAGTGMGFDKRSAIRGAVQGTLVTNALDRLRSLN